MKKIQFLTLLLCSFVAIDAEAKPKGMVENGAFDIAYDSANDNTPPEVGKWVAVVPNKGNGPLIVTPTKERKNDVIKIEAQKGAKWYSGGLVQLLELDPSAQSYTLTMNVKSISDKFRICAYIKNGTDSKEPEFYVLSSFDPVDNKNTAGTTAVKDVKDGVWTPVSFEFDTTRVADTTYSPASVARAGKDYMLKSPSDRGNVAYLCIFCMTADQSGLVDNIQMMPNK